MTRTLIRIRGTDAVHFLQGILTQDVTKLAEQKIQFAALLSPQGKILHDMFLVAVNDGILIDSATHYKDTLLKRLAMYKLRAKVEIADVSEAWCVVLGDAQGLPDPRHPDLPKRHYAIHDPRSTIHDPRSTIHDPRLTLGIPELGVDFEPDSITAMDAGYDLLNGISFTKGCYVGQEITARMHYKNIARRGFFMLENEAGVVEKLALLKFEDVYPPTSHELRAASPVTVENATFTAQLPSWMQPKLDLFKRAHENQ